jgi:hypothetical protein
MASVGAWVAGVGLPAVSRSSDEVRAVGGGGPRGRAAWGGQGASGGHGEPSQGLDPGGSGAEGGARRGAWVAALKAP